MNASPPIGYNLRFSAHYGLHLGALSLPFVDLSYLIIAVGRRNTFALFLE